MFIPGSISNKKFIRTNFFKVNIPKLNISMEDLFVVSVAFPNTSVEVAEMKYNGATLRFPNGGSFDNLEIVLLDEILESSGSISDVVYGWLWEVADVPAGNFRDVYTEVTVFDYWPDGTAISKATFYDAFPVSVSRGERTMDNADKAVVSITLNFDWMEQTEV